MKTKDTIECHAGPADSRGQDRRRRYRTPRIECLGPVHGTVLGPSPGVGESGQPQSRRWS